MFKEGDFVESRRLGVGVVLFVDNDKQRYRIRFTTKGEHYVRFTTELKPKENDEYTLSTIERKDNISITYKRDSYNDFERRDLLIEDLERSFKIGSKIKTDKGEFTLLKRSFKIFPAKEIVSDMFRWKEIKSEYLKVSLEYIDNQMFDEETMAQVFAIFKNKGGRPKDSSPVKTKKAFKEYVLKKYGVKVQV